MKHTNYKRTAWFLTFTLCGGLIAFTVTTAQAGRSGSYDGAAVAADVVKSAAATIKRASQQAKLEAVLARAKQRLAEADREAVAAAEKCLGPLQETFKQARKGTRPFAEAALSWSSKWRLMVDCLPGTRGDRHSTFMRESFERHVFSGQALSRQIEGAIAEFQRMQQDIENQVLIDLGADLESLKLQTGPPVSKEELQQRIQSLLQQAAQEAGKDTLYDVLQFTASEIAAQIVLNVAARLGISTAIVGAGTSASWATFGASIAVGIVIDWIVTTIWDWWADPTGELAAKIDGQLKQLQSELIDGPQGLKKTLTAAAAKRNEVRQKVVIQALEDWTE